MWPAFRVCWRAPAEVGLEACGNPGGTARVWQRVDGPLQSNAGVGVAFD